MAEKTKQEKPAEKKEEKKKSRKGKKVRTGKKHSKVDIKTFFTLKGDKIERTKKSCPRCGAGTFLANHKGRQYCGKCEYTEFDRRERN